MKMEESLHEAYGLYFYDVLTEVGLVYRLPITKHQFDAWNGTAPQYYRTQAKNAVTRALIDKQHG